MIEILSSGLLNSVQDLGRHAHLDVGIGWSGVMDGPALEIGNILLGNARDAAGLEIAIFPFRLRFLRAASFAVTGTDCPVELNGRPLPSWWAATAAEGDELRIGLPRAGMRATIALAGGIDVPQILGSRATDLKSGFGGFEGRCLNRGDLLPLGAGNAAKIVTPGGFGVDASGLTDLPEDEAGTMTLRVLAGAEHEAFTPTARDALYQSDWRVTAEANRMGCRLEGPVLSLVRPLELFSHGIMPGTVQVPPSGQPIIQLAEANTCGGYPKIATIITADLRRLAQARPGTRLRFQAVDRPTAIAARRQQRHYIESIAARTALMQKR